MKNKILISAIIFLKFNTVFSQEVRNNYAILIGTHNFDTIKLQTIFDNRGVAISTADISTIGTLGVERDLDKMEDFLKNRGYNKIVKLFDKNKIEVNNTLTEIKSKIKPTENLLFYFSGHGGQLKDTNGDEILISDDDTLDEFFFLKDNILVDDEISVFFKTLPKGVNIIQIMDACHSGTAMALVSNEPKEIITKTQIKQIQKFEEKEVFAIETLSTDQKTLIELFPNEIIYLGATSDNDITFGDEFGGRFTKTILEVMNAFFKKGIRPSYSMFFQEIRSFTNGELYFLPFDNNISNRLAFQIK